MDVLSELGRESQTLEYILDMMGQLAAMARGVGEDDLSLMLMVTANARRKRDERVARARTDGDAGD